MGGAVYLVRHAQAEVSSGSGDRGRALTVEGKRRFAKMLETARGAMTLSRILTSPYQRALETAELLGRVLGP